MAPTSKPKLPQLTTPVTATFPSETIFSAKSPLSVKSPLSAKPSSCCELPAKTPISPPSAYTDFLKSMSLVSPAPPTPSRTSSSASSDDSGHDSVPSTASSEQTDCSCKCGQPHHARQPQSANPLKGPATAPAIPPSPFTQMPMSAPPNGSADGFPSLKIPPSPAFSAHLDSPMSARSPFSARSVRSPFDWDAALKARYAAATDKKKKQPSRTSVRHIREVVTRTVTYSPAPRMDPAPRGKRRKVDHAAS